MQKFRTEKKMSRRGALSPVVALLERMLSLLVVLLLLLAAAVPTGRLLGHDFAVASATGQLAAQSAQLPGALMELLPEGAELVPRDSALWEVRTADGTPAGCVVDSRTLAADVVGFAGPTPIYMYVDEKDVVAGVVADDNSETPDFFRRAAEGVLHRWDGRPLDGVGEVDGVSGATYSSLALVHNMQAARQAYLHRAGGDVALTGSQAGKALAVGAVLLMGALVAWRFRGRMWLRVAILVLNVGVTGFWCGQAVSFSLLFNSARNGLDIAAALPAVLLLAVAFGAALLGRKGHYCQWACPYGSLQELAWRLPFPKVKVGLRAFRLMARIRLGALLLLMAVLWAGVGEQWLEYEPFAAFLPMQAGAAVLVLATVFVVAGCFVPRPWCRCLCPVGEVLKWTEN